MIHLTFEQRTRIGFQYLLEVLSPCSPYGQSLVRRMAPFAPGEEAELEAELGNVGRAMGVRPLCQTAWARLEAQLMQVKDITRTVEKCGGDMPLDEVELFELKRLLIQLSELRPYFDEIETAAGGFAGIAFPDTQPALALLDPEGSRVATFHVSGRYSEALSALRREKRQLDDALRAAGEEDRPALTARRREVVALEEREELIVRTTLTARLGPWREALFACTDALGRLDLTLQKAKLAIAYGGCRPEIGGDRVAFTAMVNPQLADGIRAAGKAFTPITLALGPGVTAITGANMGGKSVALKTLALNVLAVSCGFFAFAEAARMPLFNQLELLSDDLEDSSRGLSTFGGEIVRLQGILESADRGGALVLLDEFARGTNPHEGAAMARAVARYLGTKPVICAMATHYDGVAQVAAAHYQVIGLRGLDLGKLEAELAGLTGADGVSLIARYMDYGLYPVEGHSALPRDAINICRLLGLRREVLELAEGGLEE